MKRKTTPFNPDEVIRRAQTEIICALLRLEPWEKPVKINIPNGKETITSVRLVNDFHDVEISYTGCRGKTNSRILRPDPNDNGLLPLLAAVYRETETSLT